MTTENEQDRKKPLTLSSRGKLELKRPLEASSVRQSFSHGRSKTVTVEVKRKRVVGPEPTKLEVAAAEAAAAVVEAKPAAAAPAVAARKPVALRELTEEERATRVRALQGAMK